MQYRKSETGKIISEKIGLGSYSQNRVKDLGLKDKIQKNRESSQGNSTPKMGSFSNTGEFNNTSKFSNKKQVKQKTGAQLDEFGVPEKDQEDPYFAEKLIESEEDFSDD